MSNHVSPFGMWRWGKDCIEFALKAHPKPKDYAESIRQGISTVAYYLLAHGIELQLKAFLLTKNYSVETLRSRKFGHDLVKLLNESKKNDFLSVVELSEYEKELIELINVSYKAKELEYFLAGSSSYPVYSELVELAEKISRSLSGYCYKAMDKNKE